MKREYVKMRKNDIITGINAMMMISKEPGGRKTEVEKEHISISLAQSPRWLSSNSK